MLLDKNKIRKLVFFLDVKWCTLSGEVKCQSNQRSCPSQFVKFSLRDLEMQECAQNYRTHVFFEEEKSD